MYPCKVASRARFWANFWAQKSQLNYHPGQLEVFFFAECHITAKEHQHDEGQRQLHFSDEFFLLDVTEARKRLRVI